MLSHRGSHHMALLHSEVACHLDPAAVVVWLLVLGPLDVRPQERLVLFARLALVQAQRMVEAPPPALQGSDN